MGRAPCCDKANVKKGPWSPEEDATLKNYLQKHGTGGNWISLPRKAGLKRCGKSCRLRWLNYLRPDIKHGGFTEEEDNIICALYSSIGSRWSVIASRLPGRTDNDLKNYWNTKLKKKMLGGKITDAKRSSNINSSSDITINNSSDPSEQFSVSIPETETYNNPGNYSPCFSANCDTLPPLMKMEMSFQQYYRDLQGLILDQTQFPHSTFMKVPDLGTYRYNSYNCSSSSSSSSSPHQEASSLVPLDHNRPLLLCSGNGLSLEKEEGILAQDYGFGFPYEPLTDLGFQGKCFAGEVAQSLGNN
ncbi:hypothetical protein P3X46_007667 [Hevea brasiliensis]|uniref:Uncharacterized protein n=1 Tax=Hevea brasiliensis TaxID=3981 RepID=A0ABQ9MY28_HEVBR|nr:transcription factor MYB36 [Hevea brasiliensis]KAJ9183865.1 hypothetical protein P3X46_007667 [Hevea brasiliensis]